MIDIFFPFFIWPQKIKKNLHFVIEFSSFSVCLVCLHLHEVDWSHSNDKQEKLVVASRVDTKRACTRSQVGFFIEHLLFYTFTRVINAPLLKIHMWDLLNTRRAAQVRLEVLERHIWFNRGEVKAILMIFK